MLVEHRQFRAGVAAVAITLLSAGWAAAQALDREAREPTGRGFFLVGVQHLDLDDLNDRLAAHSYPALPGSMLSLGGGGWAVRGRLMVGGEGHALIGSAKTTSDGTYKSRLTAGYGMLDLGYSVLRP